MSSALPVLEWINQNFDEILIPRGFEDCVIGVAHSFEGPRAVIDYEKLLDTLQRDGMETREEAIEYFEFNILGAVFPEYPMPVYVNFPPKTKESST